MRYILLGASFAPLPTASEERREYGALPRIIVYQHAMCAANLITWWMLTYSLMPILHTTRRPGLRVLSPPPPPFIITPCRPFAMMYGDTRSPLRVEEWQRRPTLRCLWLYLSRMRSITIYILYIQSSNIILIIYIFVTNLVYIYIYIKIILDRFLFLLSSEINLD